MFSVDVSEGETVTFDSYPKADGLRKSEYGREDKIVIHYNDGISIDHVMASNTLPEFYDYAPIGIDSKVEQKNQNENCKTETSDKINTRYFCDGGLLSNTPLRELLQAHQEYWQGLEPAEKIPDLEVYIINVHPSKMDINRLPDNYDGVKDRKNDIIFGDRNSLYDEKMSHLTTDYTNLVIQLKNLAEEAIYNSDNNSKKKELGEKLKDILATKTISKDGKDDVRDYQNLINAGFKLTKVVRIERTNYINSIYGKTGDLTFETINKLIKEGECDAWFSFIQEGIKNMGLYDKHIFDTKDKLIDRLNEAMKNLRDRDYEDDDSLTYSKLCEIMDEVKKNKDKLDVQKAETLIRSIESFKALL